MDLRQLRYALAVVDEGTFTAAATACYVAQPSLSQAVASLERELGVALFERLGRRVELTAAGDGVRPGGPGGAAGGRARSSPTSARCPAWPPATSTSSPSRRSRSIR